MKTHMSASEEPTKIENDSDDSIPAATNLQTSVVELDNPAGQSVAQETMNALRVIRLDVLFSFGLVTVQTDPSLDSYMNAVEQVVTKAIIDDPNLGEKVRYDPGYKPFVKSTVWDCKLCE
jgi:hypothetical protein